MLLHLLVILVSALQEFLFLQELLHIVHQLLQAVPVSVKVTSAEAAETVAPVDARVATPFANLPVRAGVPIPAEVTGDAAI
jgi:hypothetical protein